MNRPELKNVLLSANPVKTKSTFTITIEAEDIEIIFGTAFNYARAAASAEIFAGEEVGII